MRVASDTTAKTVFSRAGSPNDTDAEPRQLSSLREYELGNVECSGINQLLSGPDSFEDTEANRFQSSANIQTSKSATRSTNRLSVSVFDESALPKIRKTKS